MAISVIYIRVSTKEQVDGHTSLDTQEKECQAYSMKNFNETVPEENIFREKGESAKFTNRTELQRMLKVLSKSNGKIKHLLIHKIDRFTRNVNDYLSLKVALSRYGVRIVSVTEPIEDDPVGRFMEAILAAAAQFDNEIRAIRVSSGMRATVEYGRWPHQAPIGYIKKNGRILPDPESSKNIKEILEEFSTKHYSLVQIAKYAYDKGVRTRTGHPKTTDQMKDLLQNWIYAGFTLNKLSTKKNKGLHVALVDESIILKNIEIISGKPFNYVRTGDDTFPLKGTLMCPICKKELRASISRGNGGLYPRYHCANDSCRKSVTGKKAGQDSTIIHRQFRELIDSWKPLKGIEGLFKTIVERAWNNEYESSVKAVAAINASLTRQRELRAAAVRKYTEDKITEEESNTIKNQCDAEIIQLESELNLANEFLEHNREAVDLAMTFITDPAGFWNQAPIQIKKDIQKLLFPDGIEYDFETGFGTAQKPETYLLIQKLAAKTAKIPDMVVATRIELVTLGL